MYVSYKTFIRIVVVLLVISLQSQAKQKLNWSGLTQEQYIENLISCETTVREYKWSKNIWPKSNKRTKPKFSEVKKSDEIYQYVLDNLNKQAILSDVFNYEITDAMLQHDMQRMANNTKDAKSLNHIFDIFGNDAETIARCISRPYLVEKKLTQNYTNNYTIHSAVRQKAQTELADYKQHRNLDDISAKAMIVTYKNSLDNEKMVAENSANNEAVINLDEQEFEQKREQLKNNKLQEHDTAFVYTQILKQQQDSIKVKILTWEKQSQNNWLQEQAQPEYYETPKTHDFSLPKIKNNKTAIADTWETTFSTIDARSHHTAVWTGTEMIVWGGINGNYTNTGGRYDPVTDSWLATSRGAYVPTARIRHTAVWTGSEMIIWGGLNGVRLNTGGRYDPATNSWLPISTGTDVPTARYYHTAVWTGSEMIVWGGYDGARTNTGGRYDPTTDSWLPTSTIGDVPSARYDHTAVWADSLTNPQMIIWGGFDVDFTNTGARYNPDTDTWLATNADAASDVPTDRQQHAAVWTGTEMIIWGGSNDSYLNSGGRYDPINDSWVTTSIAANVPTARQKPAVVWTDTYMVIWGGYDGNYLNTGGRYNPSSDSWLTTDTGMNVPSARQDYSTVWTGTQMIIWGGYDNDYLNTGGRYDPIANSWQSMNTAGNIPTAQRSSSSAIWTGTEMIVWGGLDFNNSSINTGERYNPVTDSWLPTSTGTNVPSARSGHTAVWTGTEMIVWGSGSLNTGGRYDPVNDSWLPTSVDTNTPAGSYGSSTTVWTGTEMIVWGGNGFNTGARYNPVTDSWLPTSTGANVPLGRSYHSAVWTGSEMIVWGENGNTGGRYNPVTDSWLPTSTGANVPSRRYLHKAIWTGTEMIVWGGYSDGNYLNTGGRYDPATDTWLPISTGANVPSVRSAHTIVWTGAEMIVWGGEETIIINGNSKTNTGSRYDPISDTWLPTSTGANVPTARKIHSSVWTGTQMLIWAGKVIYGQSYNLGIYNPSNRYSISGTLSGLNGNQVVLQNNGGDDLTLSTNGMFTFANLVREGSEYDVTVLSNPSTPEQICTVSNAWGNNITANINDINVTCNTAPTVANDSYTINEDSAFIADDANGSVGDASNDGILVNDTDAEGEVLNVVNSGAYLGSIGDLIIAADGTFTYTPTTDANGQDAFNLSITDGTSTVATVLTINVQAVNDQPSFVVSNIDVSTLVTTSNTNFVVPGFANTIVLGPIDEQNSQSVQQFTITNISDSNGILNAGTISIATDGTLSADLSLNSGTAVIDVIMQDDGGVDFGGVDTSSTQQFTLTYSNFVFDDGFE